MNGPSSEAYIVYVLSISPTLRDSRLTKSLMYVQYVCRNSYCNTTVPWVYLDLLNASSCAGRVMYRHRTWLAGLLVTFVLPVLFNTITFQVVYAAMSYFALSACQMDVTIDLAALGAASRDDDGNGKSVFQVRAL